MQLSNRQSQPKKPVFHKFLWKLCRFCLFLPDFTRFWRFDPPLQGTKPGNGKTAGTLYFSPKSTVFLGASVAAIGAFSASTTGAASRK
jgi:hypothetical protein